MKRGNPSNNDTVHYHVTIQRDDKQKGLPPIKDAMCRTGAYHIFMTKDIEKVTCKKCLEMSNSNKGKTL